MKIYEIKDNGEKFWYSNKRAIGALKTHLSIYYITMRDMDNSDDIIEIPKSEWGEYNILNIDETDKEGNYKVIETFDDYMKRETKPGPIATTLF